MENWLLYIIKASAILILFHTAYEVFLKRETFFSLNRVFLLSGVVLAAIHPILRIKHYVEMVPVTQISNGSLNPVEAAPLAVSTGLDWLVLLQWLFVAGCSVMALRLLMQLFSLRKILLAGRIIKSAGYKLVEVKRDIAPFSFFNYIFYNPDKHPEEELTAIMDHEKVHCKQWHSLDVLIANTVLIWQWFNPVSWFYIANIKQNLEFLADREATSSLSSPKSYQYTMLKVSVIPRSLAVSNSFYNSLIKKRIVMLNRTKSKKHQALKTLIIVPVLTLFLYAFNSEMVYLPAEGSTPGLQITESKVQTIKIHINKDTSDKELEDLKKDLRKKGIDFSYTVVHNDQKEIIDISITITTKKKGSQSFIGSSSFNNDGSPIDPVNIIFNGDKNFFFTGKDGEEVKMIHQEKSHSTWVYSDDDAHQSIEIYKDDGKETIRVNGKEISRAELEDMEKEGKLHTKKIKIQTIGKAEKDSHIMIMSDHESDHNVEVISGDGGGFFFMDGELGDDWIILLNGEVVGQDKIKELEPDDIERINVIKGDSAVKKYGEEIEHALEITTKQ